MMMVMMVKMVVMMMMMTTLIDDIYPSITLSPQEMNQYAPFILQVFNIFETFTSLLYFLSLVSEVTGQCPVY